MSFSVGSKNHNGEGKIIKPNLNCERIAAAFLASLLSLLTVPTHAQSNQGLVSSREVVDQREDGSGAFRTNCLESHDSYDDPLVFPNQPAATHHHIFFGNPTVNADTTIASLQDAQQTTCDGGTLNRSAYWVPALYDAYGERIAYVDPLFYYKTGYHVPAASIQPPPPGLRMIAGNAMARSPQSTQVAKFRCASWQSNQAWFDPGDPLDHVPYIPNCAIDDLVEIRIVFPQCWDGVHLDSPDHQRHMAYPSEASPPKAGTGACPASHPIAIPEISYNFVVYVTEDTGPSTLWRFASDMGGETLGGASLHGDWMNGWNTDIMAQIVRNCLQAAQECGVGLLGDGRKLNPVVVD